MVQGILAFHAVVHASPADAGARRPMDVDGVRVEVMPIDAARHAIPMGIRFEDAARGLSRIPRMFLEPDGSFVWVGETGGRPWQIDGTLIDGRDNSLMCVMLKGVCPPAALDQLLKCLGWPARPVVFELVEQAVVLDEASFRRVAAQGHA